jgi:hypothetical protein
MHISTLAGFVAIAAASKEVDEAQTLDEAPSAVCTPTRGKLRFDARELDKWVRQRNLVDAEPLVVVFVDEKYWPVLLNFFIFLSALDGALPAKVGTVCLDAAVEDRLRNVGAPPCLVPSTHGSANKTLSALWAFRVRLASCLLKMGTGLIFSDADALWIRDAREYFRSGVADVLASRGTYPDRVRERWGQTLCMGFILFKPTVASQRLLRRMAARCSSTCDDQNVVNLVLLQEANLSWAGASGLVLKQLKVTDAHAAHGQGWFGTTPIRVTLLPSSDVERHCLPAPSNATVRHCLSGGKSHTRKRQTAVQLGTWALDDRWKDVPARPPLQTYLEHVARGKEGGVS